MSASTSFQIKKISAAETVDLRLRILRPGQPIENCQYPGDDAQTTFHIGILHDGQVIANGTFMKEAHPKFSNAKNSYRLRGMAADTSYQRQGLGTLVINEALKELKSVKCDLLWFNARTSAEIFYKKLGFISLPEVFDIPLAGPHKVMYKWFN